MRAALTVEWWKVRRAPVVLVATVLQVVLVPLLGWVMVAIAGGGGGVGAVAAKAELLVLGEGWTGFVGAVAQVAAAAMFVGAGVVVAWVFGREHAEGTFASLHAVAVPRAAVASAKLVVIAMWSIVVAVSVAAMTLLVGVLAGIGVEPWSVVLPLLVRLTVVAAATTLLAIPVGWVASIGRGYLPAIGAVVVVLAVSQVVVLLGAGSWFPFAVPGLVAVAGAEGVPRVTWLGVTTAATTIVVGGAATIRWWHRAEVA